MTRALRGIGVSPGVACAPAFIVRMDFPEVPDRTVRPERSRAARCAGCAKRWTTSCRHLQDLGQRVLQRAGPEESRIFDAQILMVAGRGFPGLGRDPDPQQPAQRRDRLRVQGARAAQPLVRRRPALRERLADLHAIQLRMLNRLMGGVGHELWSIPADEQVIVVAHELSPGLTVQLDREHVVGLISEEGTRTSHAAILAHSLGIPAVMGAVGALAEIPPGMMVLLDGQAGTIVLDPTRDELEDAKTQVSRRHRLELQLEAVVERAGGHARRPADHAHGQRRPARGDRGGGAHGGAGRRAAPHRVPAHRPRHAAHRGGADRLLPPRRRRVPRAHRDHPLATTSAATSSPRRSRRRAEANPFLGWRSIRVCLDQPEVFRPQLRALLRAAVDRDIQLMLPLVTLVEEVEEAREHRAGGGGGAPAARASARRRRCRWA